MVSTILDILWQSWLVLGQMSPYLLLGFLIAVILSVCIPPTWVERWLGRPGMLPVLTASIVGTPLPLCSCGVIPVGASIRRHGASRAATASFLLSTPQTGIDSILVTYGMLGLVLAVFRPVVALITGLVGGALVLLIGEREVGDLVDDDRPGVSAQETAGCSAECCTPGPGRNRILSALRYGFVTLPRDLGNSLLIGVLLAGLITALVPPGQFRVIFGGGLVSILVMMAAAIPVYVCATASVPLAAGLIFAGASPGAALAFLIAGPATNAATVATIWHVLGRRSTLAYLLTVAVSAVASGLLLNWWWPELPNRMPALVDGAHAHEAVGLSTHVWAAVLLAVLGLSYLQGYRLARRFSTRQNGESTMAEPGKMTIDLNVRGMTCSHCAAAVERTLAEQPGVEHVAVDLGAGRATVTGEGFDEHALVGAVGGLGYKAERGQ